MNTLIHLFTLCLIASSLASAGTVYKVTSTEGKNTITYEVKFGGGRMFEQYTAYDPASGKFVYLTFKRGEDAPKAVAQIFDHTTGKKIDLFKFPKAKHPLPVIPQIKDLKACPKTGDHNFKSKIAIMYD